MGGGNIISTAEDLVRFSEPLLEPGFRSRDALEMVYSPLPVDGGETTWSFGWFTTTDEVGRRRLHINAANPGLQAELRVYPDEDLVVAVVANRLGTRCAIGRDGRHGPLRRPLHGVGRTERLSLVCRKAGTSMSAGEDRRPLRLPVSIWGGPG